MGNPLAPSWLSVPADLNSFDASIWPSSVHRAENGEVRLGGVAVSALAAEYGTPLYLYDTQMIRERAAEISRVFQDEFARVGTKAKVYYAGKAFLSSDIVHWMLEAGLNIDVSTGGELALALAAGAEGARLGLHGNNKSDAELETAIAAELGTIVIDYPGEIARIQRIAALQGRTQGVRLRVRTGVHAHTHDFLATAHEDQKFGVSLREVPALVAEIRASENLNFMGLHGHIGSQIFGAEGFAASLEVLLEMHTQLLEGGDIPELNIGGGFGIAYTEADSPMPIAEIAATLADALASTAARLGLATLPTIALEPGRWIVGPAGVTLYRTGALKDVELETETGQKATRRYLSVDGGMSDNARPALYEADYQVRLAGRSSTAEPVLVRLAGKHCESGDIVVYQDYLQSDVAADELVLVAATGAYCWALSSNYNFLHRPAVVGVADGKAELMVYGETVAELLSRDAGLDRRSTAAAHSPNIAL
ncbi:MAG: diaminopimelate decarboxylase [Microbacteriaceae bacterium]